jgi:hypothetical protein
VKVVYVSKASRVAAHRDKLAIMKGMVDLTLVVPHRWANQPDEPILPTDPRTIVLPAILHGHNHLHLYRGLASVLDAEQPDLVYADEESYSAVTAQVAALSTRRGVPFVFHAWQNLPKRIPPPFGLLRTLIFERAAGGLAGTPTAARLLRTWGFRGPVEVVPQMGVDPERFRPDLGARERVRSRLRLDGFVVGFVGRLIPEKGVHLLLEAVRDLPAVRVLIVGGGPEEERLRRRAAELGIADRVRITGAVASVAVPEYMAALDVLVLASLTTRGWAEQFGRVLIEAMACGIPLVGSDSGEIPSVMGDAGVVVPEGSVAHLVSALASLMDDSSRRKCLGERGRARAASVYSQRAVADATVEFLRRITAARATAPVSG